MLTRRTRVRAYRLAPTIFRNLRGSASPRSRRRPTSSPPCSTTETTEADDEPATEEEIIAPAQTTFDTTKVEKERDE
jgi:hypothetical protein